MNIWKMENNHKYIVRDDFEWLIISKVASALGVLELVTQYLLQ